MAKVIRTLLETSAEPMRRVHCLKNPPNNDPQPRDILTVDFDHCENEGIMGDDEEEGGGEGVDGLVFLLTIVFVSLVLVTMVSLAVLLLVRRCRTSSSSSSSGVSTLESDYRSLPYPGDVRRRGEECMSNSLLSQNHI